MYSDEWLRSELRYISEKILEYFSQRNSSRFMLAYKGITMHNMTHGSIELEATTREFDIELRKKGINKKDTKITIVVSALDECKYTIQTHLPDGIKSEKVHQDNIYTTLSSILFTL